MAVRLPALTAAQVEQRILLLRGQKVMLDADLAALYGVEARALNQAVVRNRDRFPSDFMFQISAEEYEHVRPRFVSALEGEKSNSSQTVMSSRKYRGHAYRPYAFTEQGVAMLSSVLRSKRAVMVNIEIMRAFVRLRQMLASNAELARKLATLEKKYDAQFKVVFDVIRELMTPPERKKRSIGFAPWEEKK